MGRQLLSQHQKSPQLRLCATPGLCSWSDWVDDSRSASPCVRSSVTVPQADRPQRPWEVKFINCPPPGGRCAGTPCLYFYSCILSTQHNVCIVGALHTLNNTDDTRACKSQGQRTQFHRPFKKQSTRRWPEGKRLTHVHSKGPEEMAQLGLHCLSTSV